jgi:hypothetical protein
VFILDCVCCYLCCAELAANSVIIVTIVLIDLMFVIFFEILPRVFDESGIRYHDKSRRNR